MLLSSLSVEDFRSIAITNLSFHKNINIICGQNNAGKTTILEAIYFCSNLRSFKSISNKELIKKSSSYFKISLNFTQNSINNNIFLEKSLKSSKCLFNSKRITKNRLMLEFPCYSLVFGFNNILLNDSSYRRDFIDSGMFHVEPSSIKDQNEYDKCLRQRNYVLRSQKTESLSFWDKKIVECNDILSRQRLGYFKQLKHEFAQIIYDIKENIPEIYDDISSLELIYNKGWQRISFEEELVSNRARDLKVGHTSSGTHRSDFLITSKGKPVKESGSMSTLVLACLVIYLAKINVFHVKHGYKPILLIDDLFFGIDNKNLTTVVKLLVHSRGNIVLTAPNIYRDILKEISEKNQEIDLKTVGVFN